MSSKAEDFINDEEILESLDYAEKHKTDDKFDAKGCEQLKGKFDEINK